jgi:hydroxypyruvate reductase
LVNEECSSLGLNVTLVEDAQAIASRWMADLDLTTLMSERLRQSTIPEGGVDLVAVGKASPEMAHAARTILAGRVRREILVGDESALHNASGGDTLIGEHPVPGEGSLLAGRAVVSFLESDTHADTTLFLISGGASSLCVFPAPPLTLEDLNEVWRAALRAGVDITTLNQIRATSSLIAGGALLRSVRSARTKSLILVDNVVSGAPWVASAMTYDYLPTIDEVHALWAKIDVDASLRLKLLAAFEERSRVMASRLTPLHENVIVGEPAMMLSVALKEASRRGYHVVDMGARVIGDVGSVAHEWGKILGNASEKTAVIGVGEVTVKVEGTGVGGRCQEFAWLMAKELSDGARHSAFAARSSDGRDYVEGVAGAWVTDNTSARIEDAGLDWLTVARAHDTYPALRALGQLIEGGHTGWNLCDVYVALVD